jgi:hypothetical protein
MNSKEIKQEIRKLRKIKKQLRPGSKERIEIHHKIKSLLQELTAINTPNIVKDAIINEILKHDKLSQTLVNAEPDFLNKYTIEQLKINLKNILNRNLTK